MFTKTFVSLSSALFLLSQLFGSSLAFKYAVAADHTPLQGSLIISAVQITGGTNHTQEDFIELFNPTDNDIDLKGYRLVKRTATGTADSSIKSWTESAVIQAHHFYLWANSSFPTISAKPDLVSTATLADNNGVAIRFGASDTGAIIDGVAWGNTTNGFEIIHGNNSNPGAAQSLIRKDLYDSALGFKIDASSPRNSSAQQLPPVPDVVQLPAESQPEPEPEPKSEAQQPSESTQTEPTQPSAAEPIPQETVAAESTPAETPVTETTTPEPQPTQDPQTPQETKPEIKITELLPNPVGTDSGAEKIELVNSGSEPTDLAGLILDDSTESEGVTSNAYTFSSDAIVEPGEIIVVTLSPGDFAMNNTSGDVVTLFNDDSKTLDSVTYSGTAEEGESYTKFDSNWEWTDPTLGSDNGQPPVVENTEEEQDEPQPVEEVEKTLNYDNSGLVFSEIYASPSSGQTEFIELFNKGEENAQLSGVAIWVGEKHKVLPEVIVNPGEYYVLESGLPAQLRNSGQTLKLTEDTKTLSTITYSTAIKGSSYSVFEDGYLWTTAVTKGKVNKLEIPTEVKKVVAKSVAATQKTIAKKVTAAAKSAAKKATAKTTTKASSDTAKKSAASVKANSNTNNADSAPIEQTSSKNKEPLGKIIAMGAAAAAAGVVALYKLVFAAGLE